MWSGIQMSYQANQVLQFHITCLSNQWKLSLVGTLHFLGIVLGSAIFGFLADMYGRKNVLIAANIIMSLTGIAQALSTSYVTFSIWNLLNAVGTAGVYPMAFILGECGSHSIEFCFPLVTLLSRPFRC